jgi:hypothetical protein
MRGWRWFTVMLALVLPLAALAGWSMRRGISATADERAVLTVFMPMLQNPNCKPGWTTGGLGPPAKRNWVEVDERESARLEVALRHATGRDSRLRTDEGWMGSVLSSTTSSILCREDVRVSTPFFGDGFAFVMAKSNTGVAISAFERRLHKWVWISASWQGDPIIQY